MKNKKIVIQNAKMSHFWYFLQHFRIHNVTLKTKNKETLWHLLETCTTLGPLLNFLSFLYNWAGWICVVKNLYSKTYRAELPSLSTPSLQDSLLHPRGMSRFTLGNSFRRGKCFSWNLCGVLIITPWLLFVLYLISKAWNRNDHRTGGREKQGS